MHIELAKKFCAGEYEYDLDGILWTNAFQYIIANQEKLEFSNNEIHTIWTVNGGHLRNKIRDDGLILEVLTITLPSYEGNALILYRGECRFLYEQGKIGFCWTPNIEVAEKFARGLNSIESGGVLLKAHAPAEAILSSPNAHSTKQMKEFEYTCNPNMLKKIQVEKTYDKHPHA